MRKKIWPSEKVLLGLIVLAGSLAGCSGSDRPDTIPVTGTITFNGGPPPAGGTIYFNRTKKIGEYPLRPGTAAFDTDGEFTVKSWEEGDGLVPGEYSIKAECWEKMPTMEDSQGVSHMPEKYRSGETSGWTVTVEEDGDAQELNLDVVTE